MRTSGRHSFAPRWTGIIVAFAMGIIPMTLAGPVSAAPFTAAPYGALDCNGMSPVQHLIHPANACADIRGFAGVDNRNTWGGRFYDNGRYIGHDEPDMTFFSNAKGSGNNVTWTETLGTDPAAAPTVATPGSDVAHWFELSLAPWYSMAICDPNSYPQLACTPDSDSNAPACANGAACLHEYPGGGSALLELQFYPPGFAPFIDSISCDNTHWCSALTIDSLECTNLFAQCNRNCEEPVNYAFIQTNGVPTGPPAPQNSDDATAEPNADTLLMNPGDKISTHIWDAPAPGGGHALEAVVDDLTTHQSGYMQASAANGFQSTSLIDCSGTPFNFEPEYSTATRANFSPWTALQTNISTEYETGHFEACTSLSQPSGTLAGGSSDVFYNSCAGPYEAPDSSEGAEAGDALCYRAGDTHGTLASAPDEITGCLANWFQNGDLDFDGTPYWAEWPTSSHPTATLPGSFVESPPQTKGHQYSEFMFQTDTALSESTCSSHSPKGCAVPPPGAPGKFFPYWSEIRTKSGTCSIEFGNVAAGSHLNNFHKDAQYGTPQFRALGYPEIEGKVKKNACKK